MRVNVCVMCVRERVCECNSVQMRVYVVCVM